jgi:hypothetical protein
MTSYLALTFTMLGNAGALLRRWLWFVTGADARVLRDPNCPESERTKFDSIGAAMCLTTGLAFLAGWSAFYQISFPGLHEYELFGTPLRATMSFVLAVIWTLVIFNMQRFIMLSSRRVSDHGTLHLVDWLHTLPGVVLSLSVALTVATPLQVLLLNAEIDVQLLEEAQTKKSAVHAAIEARFDTERFALAEKALQLREQSGHDMPLSDAEPACVKTPVAVGERAPTARHAACLQAVDVWYAALAHRIDEWKQNHVNPSEIALADAVVWYELQRDWLNVRVARERLLADMRFDQGAGLIKRAEIGYDVNPLSSWGLFLVVCFIQGVPVVIRAVSPRGPYDDLLGMVSRQHLAAAGIEPAALNLFDRAGKSYPVDLFRIAKDKEQQTLAALQAERSALRRQRLMEFEQRHKMILNRVKQDVKRDGDAHQARQ